MFPETTAALDERRRDTRLVAAGRVEVIVLDPWRQPLAAIPAVEAVNVSAGGMAVLSPRPIPVGDLMAVRFGAGASLGGKPAFFEAVECVAWDGQRHLVRCKLIEGRLPASMVRNV